MVESDPEGQTGCAARYGIPGPAFQLYVPFVITTGASGGSTGVQSVYYRGIDDEIHELWWDADLNSWLHRAIGQEAGAPTAAGNPASHAWSSRGMEQVYYRGGDGQIHELWWRDFNNMWQHRPIGEEAGAPAAAGDLTSHLWERRETQSVFYRGVDDEIHELWWREISNTWQKRAIGQEAGAPEAAGDPASHVRNFRGTEHVYYRDGDGQIHELWWDETTNEWLHLAISQEAGAPAAAGDPASHIWDSRKSQGIYYLGADGQIHELWCGSFQETWQHRAIGQEAGAPEAIGEPTSHIWESRDSQSVYYRGTDNQIHELWWREVDNTWQHRAIGEEADAPAVAGNPASHVWESRDSQSVYYRGVDNQIHELWWRVGENEWSHRAIGEEAGAPPADGDPVSHVMGE